MRGPCFLAFLSFCLFCSLDHFAPTLFLPIQETVYIVVMNMDSVGLIPGSNAYFYVLPFLCLLNGGDKGTYFTGLWLALNQLLFVVHLDKHLVHSKHYIKY